MSALSDLDVEGEKRFRVITARGRVPDWVIFLAPQDPDALPLGGCFLSQIYPPLPRFSLPRADKQMSPKAVSKRGDLGVAKQKPIGEDRLGRMVMDGRVDCP